MINPKSPQTMLSNEQSLVFLAGPIQGADDWQRQLAKILETDNDSVVCATPRVPAELDSNFVYEEQVNWEQTHLMSAKVVVFWFAEQNLRLDYPPGRSYAQTSRFELGQIFGMMSAGVKLNLVLGISPDYSTNGGGNERYFRYHADINGIKVCESLVEVAEEVQNFLDKD